MSITSSSSVAGVATAVSSSPSSSSPSSSSSCSWSASKTSSFVHCGWSELVVSARGAATTLSITRSCVSVCVCMYTRPVDALHRWSGVYCVARARTLLVLDLAHASLAYAAAVAARACAVSCQTCMCVCVTIPYPLSSRLWPLESRGPRPRRFPFRVRPVPDAVPSPVGLVFVDTNILYYIIYYIKEILY
jgi:hypothetical protein